MRFSDVKGHSARPRLVVDVNALVANYRELETLAGRARIGACVKADGYGLGAAMVARALYGAGCRTFFVATAGEGAGVREAVGETPVIYVLNGPAPQDLTLLFKHTLRPVLNSVYQVRLWEAQAVEARRAPFSALMIDTGMNRLGVSEADLRTLSRKVWERVGLDHVMSHLACADAAANPMNAAQLARFRKAAALLPPKTMSLANSAGMRLGPDYRFQMVRPGIALYGGRAGGKSLESVASLEASVLQLREVRAGDTLGYDATFTAPRDMRVAVVGAGYADGIPVALSGRGGRPGGRARINDATALIVGRVSMDLTLLDVTDVDVALGESARFFGPLLAESADRAGLLDYELLTGLGTRARRDYLRGSAGDGGKATPRSAPSGWDRRSKRSGAGAARPRAGRDKRSGPPKGRRPRP